ncbi:hypothetical protein C0J52_25774 [Blattella germanica]|nr:hypothetical protein C0J52_25774 [Blattella germanica]
MEGLLMYVYGVLKTMVLASLSNKPHAQIYNNSAEVMRNANAWQNLALRFVDNISMDKRRFNKPTANEIAGVFCLD